MRNPLLILLVIFSHHITLSRGCSNQTGIWVEQAQRELGNIRDKMANLRQMQQCNGVFRHLDQSIKYINFLNDELQNEDRDKESLKAINSAISLEAASSLAGDAPSGLKNMVTKILTSASMDASSMNGGQIMQMSTIAKSSMSLSLNIMRSLNEGLNKGELKGCSLMEGVDITSILTSTVRLANIFGDDIFGAKADSASFLKELSDYLRFGNNFNISEGLVEAMDTWQDISCLIETTTETYCSILDAKDLNRQLYADEQNRLENEYLEIKPVSGQRSYDPMSGYFVMARDIPNIQDWVLKILFGNMPWTHSEADRKNAVWETLIGLYKDENKGFGAMNQMKLEADTIFSGIDTDNGKKQMIIQIVSEMTSHLKYGERNTFNFVLMNYNKEELPFRILGFDKVPPPVTGIKDETMGKGTTWTDPKCGKSYDVLAGARMRWNDFLSGSGDYHCILDQPEQLLSEIRLNFSRIMETAKKQAQKYINEFLVVDNLDQITRLFDNYGVSVHESLINVKNYVRNLTYKTRFTHGKLLKDFWVIKSSVDKMRNEKSIGMTITDDDIESGLYYTEALEEIKILEESIKKKEEVEEFLTKKGDLTEEEVQLKEEEIINQKVNELFEDEAVEEENNEDELRRLRIELEEKKSLLPEIREKSRIKIIDDRISEKNSEYLELISKYERLDGKLTGAKTVLLSMENLLFRLDKVTTSLRERSGEFMITPDKAGYEEKIREFSSELIQVFFDELNIVFQQSNFLSRRLNTFLNYDMRLLLREDKLSDELDSWLTLSKNIINTLSKNSNLLFDSSNAQNEAGMDAALQMANTGLNAVENITKNYLFGAIFSLDMAMKGLDGKIGTYLKSMKINAQQQNFSTREIDQFQTDFIDIRNTHDPSLSYEENIRKQNEDDIPKLIEEYSGKMSAKKGGKYNPWSYLKTSYYMWINRDRYPVYYVTSQDTVTFKNYTQDKSFQKLKDRLCIQGLFFEKNRGELRNLCQGAAYSNSFIEGIQRREKISEYEMNRRRLKLNFDYLYSVDNDKTRVCAVRDYFRNNKALELLNEIK